MKLALIFLLGMNCAFAKTTARVLEVQGKAFYYGASNSIKTLKYSDKIELGSRVMVEDGASLTLKTDDNSMYYLTSGTHLKFYKDGVELKNGKLWVTVADDSIHRVVQTANAKSIHQNGQYVYSFNNELGKTQVLTVFGKTMFSNLEQKDLQIPVLAGEFSFVKNGLNKGFPRRSTRVGVNSYEHLKVTFKDFKDIQNLKIEDNSKQMSLHKTKKRAIASVVEKPTQGKIKFVSYTYKSNLREIASVAKTPVVKKSVKPFSGKTARVRVFGSKKSTFSKRLSVKSKKTFKVIPNLGFSSHKRRLPASITPQPHQRNTNTVSLFEKSLRQNIQVAPRHSSEVNQLIDDLESYKEDFAKEY